MEIEDYICPKCQIRLKKSIWENKYYNFIDGVCVNLYEGICKSCKSGFTFFYDSSYDKAVFWKKNDEFIFKEQLDKKIFYSSLKLLYLTEMKNSISVIEKYKKIANANQNIIVAPHCFSNIINRCDLRRNNKILFIDECILNTKFEKNYPCILAEKNICELIKNYKNYRLYSDSITYYKIFEYLGE